MDVDGWDLQSMRMPLSKQVQYLHRAHTTLSSVHCTGATLGTQMNV